MSFDKIFDLAAGVYFNFYSIYQLPLQTFIEGIPPAQGLGQIAVDANEGVTIAHHDVCDNLHLPSCLGSAEYAPNCLREPGTA